MKTMLESDYLSKIAAAEERAQELFRAYVEAARSGTGADYVKAYQAWGKQCEYIEWLVSSFRSAINHS